MIAYWLPNRCGFPPNPEPEFSAHHRRPDTSMFLPASFDAEQGCEDRIFPAQGGTTSESHGPSLGPTTSETESSLLWHVGEAVPFE